ncbi:hypothetical protein [Marinobacterium rhizophilum]|uniref:Uncharacterized protein n=1 Tax=Marinobacterium rhizophilum TaxID=420402 RepID=A0ABY5HLC7_9GAMM|nr:hypothetical protein [Marinobacterium rhizophilum]UTW12064.1 hypothetical protein KDW95_23045 [Marinobacterium rhizophilum]
MNDFALKALEFGVLGLCAITLLLVFGVLQAEQKREGTPRKGILQASYVFMAFSLVLAALNGYVQLHEQEVPPDAAQNVAELEARLRTNEDKLLQIRSAAAPILNARSNILQGLPPGPARDTLLTLVDSLRETLQ